MLSLRSDGDSLYMHLLEAGWQELSMPVVYSKPRKLYKCFGCNHHESFHPVTSASQSQPTPPANASKPSQVEDVLARYSALDRLCPKASEEEARKETNAGFTKSRSETTASGSERGGATKFQVISL
jgi:hypothetical protein